MSINERIKLINSTISCFSSMPTQYSEPRGKYKKTFHQSIKQNKDRIYHYFEEQPYYKELMPVIAKNQRGNFMYKKLIKTNKNSRKSTFFVNLMKAVEEVHKRSETVKKEKTNSKNFFKLSRVNILKQKKAQILTFLSKKTKTVDDDIKTLHKSKSMLNYLKIYNKDEGDNFLKSVNNFQTSNINNATNTSNLNEGIISMDTFQTFNQNMESTKNNLKELSNLSNFNLTKLSIIGKTRRDYNHSSTRRLTRKSIDLSEYFKKQERFIYQNNKKRNKILDKCERSLNHAREAEKDIEQSEKENKSVNIYAKFKNAIKSDDQKVIENIDDGNKKFKEYQKIQQDKFNFLKKNIDIKLSDEYAYMIRNELQDTFGVNGAVLAYQLYLKDNTKMKEKVTKNLEEEKKTIRKVKDLLDDSIRRKEFLKYKIDTLRMKQEKFNEIKNYNFNKKDNYGNKDYSNEDLKGNLLPKLKEVREQCYQNMDYNINPNKI